MNRLLLIGIGATFTSLVLFAPVLVMERWADLSVSTTNAMLLALPVLVLLAMTAFRSEMMIYWLFPVSHLPALVVEERLTSSEFYSGWSGVLAVAAVALVGVAYVLAASWRSRPPARRRPAKMPMRLRVLNIGTLVLALAVFWAFASPVVIGSAADPLSGSLSVVVGCTVIWVIVGGPVWTGLASPWLDPSMRRSVVVKTLTVKRPSVKEVWATLILITTTLLGVLVWYAARSAT